MVHKLADGLWQVRGWFVTSYLLVEGRSACGIDGGFTGDFRQFEMALAQEGLGWGDVRAVLLTHGHLDHTYNVARIAEASGATVYGHPADHLHFEGRYPYGGLSRACGWLEWLGRSLFGFRPVQLDREIADGETLDLWGGLQVVHTPGHTAGHCGFYSPGRRLLFSGDLFANWLPWVILPWPWLNSCPEHFPASINKVLDLEPEGILTNHCGHSGPREQRDGFVRRFGFKR